MKYGDILIESIDLVEIEMDSESGSKKSKNPLLLGLSPLRYMLRSLRSIKSADLEQVLFIKIYF